MNTQPTAIKRLVDHVGGPTATARAMGDKLPYQRIAEWVKRGWASPHYWLDLKPLMPQGMRLEDLAADKERAKQAA